MSTKRIRPGTEFQTGSMKEISTSRPMTEEEHKAMRQKEVKARRDNEDRLVERREKERR